MIVVKIRKFQSFSSLRQDGYWKPLQRAQTLAVESGLVLGTFIFAYLISTLVQANQQDMIEIDTYFEGIVSEALFNLSMLLLNAAVASSVTRASI